MSRSLRDDAGRLRVGGVRHQQVDAVRAEPGEPADVGQAPVQRELVHLEVAGVQHEAGMRADADRERVRDRVVHGEELEVERAEPLPRALGDLGDDRGQAVLGELAPDQRERQPRPDQREVGALAQQVRQGADVVFVRVGEHHRVDQVEPPLEVAEVRQDQVDAGLVGLGEQDTAVDDEQPAVVLEDGHVPADFTEAAERDDPQAPSGQRRGQGKLGMGMTHCAVVQFPSSGARVRSWPPLVMLSLTPSVGSYKSQCPRYWRERNARVLPVARGAHVRRRCP